MFILMSIVSGGLALGLIQVGGELPFILGTTWFFSGMIVFGCMLPTSNVINGPAAREQPGRRGDTDQGALFPERAASGGIAAREGLGLRGRRQIGAREDADFVGEGFVFGFQCEVHSQIPVMLSEAKHLMAMATGTLVEMA